MSDPKRAELLKAYRVANERFMDACEKAFLLYPHSIDVQRAMDSFHLDAFKAERALEAFDKAALSQ
jgi:hypothetical protein